MEAPLPEMASPPRISYVDWQEVVEPSDGGDGDGGGGEGEEGGGAGGKGYEL